MFMLAVVFQEAASQAVGTDNALWTPPYYSLFINSSSAITALFSLGVLMIIPQTCNRVRDAMKAPPTLPLGIGSIFGPVGSTVSTGLGLSSQFFYMQHSLGFISGLLGRGKSRGQQHD
jgi:hypothetical protein